MLSRNTPPGNTHQLFYQTSQFRRVRKARNDYGSPNCPLTELKTNREAMVVLKHCDEGVYCLSS